MASDAAFFKLHDDLPRQGIGSDWCTREAISRLPPLRRPTAVMDLGCGPGRQTILLAKRFKGDVVAVDTCRPFLDQLMEAAEAAGVGTHIQPRCEDFLRLKDLPGSYDLVWSEGAISAPGWTRALEAWAPLLRARGIMAISDCTWTTPTPPAEAANYWNETYPTMSDAAGYAAAAEAAGLKLFDQFTLPRSAWWESYLAPLSRRVAALESQAGDDPDLGTTLRDAKREISIFERYGDSFAYIFYLLRLN